MEPDELEAAARAVLPPDVYDYIAGGAFDELTLAANRLAWNEIELLPRVLRDVTTVDLGSTLLGRPAHWPVAVAPMAAHHLVDEQGAETSTAAAATAAGSIFIASTRSRTPIEAVAEAVGPAGRLWFQVYVMNDRDLTRKLVLRAAAAGAEALVLTADTPVIGRRLRDVRNAFQLTAAATNAPTDQNPGVTFADIAWLSEMTGGLPVIVKGVLHPADAAKCVQWGAAGIAVSNHGGRQLDGAIATARALPAIAAVVGHQVPVFVDGGIRRGTDVVKALAMGASAVFLGRPVLWGLAAGGVDGATKVLTELRDELALAMALCGCPTVGDVTSDLVASLPSS